MSLPDAPRFRVSWLRPRTRAAPEWLADGRWTPAGDWELYTRIRAGLSAILRRCEPFSSAETVLLPAYIPRGVVQAFRQNDVAVRFYPVTEDLRLPAGVVRDQIRSAESDVVLFVHYFGFEDPSFARLAAAARDAGAAVVEDCARALFSRAPDGTLLGTTGDLSTFSLHKVLPVPHGGLLVANGIEDAVPMPSTTRSETRDAVVSLACSVMNQLSLTPHVMPILSATAGGDAASAVPETSDTGPLARPGTLSSIGLSKRSPADIVTHRRRLYRRLYDRLDALDGLETLTPPLHEGACPFGVAVRTTGGRGVRDHVFDEVVSAGLPVKCLQWPLVRNEDLPDTHGARTLRDTMLVFPTHQQMPSGSVTDVADEVEAALD